MKSLKKSDISTLFRSPRTTRRLLFATFCFATSTATAGEQTTDQTYVFSPSHANPQARLVTPQTTYSPSTGYGIEPNDNANPATDAPLRFSTKLPEGTYRVDVSLGNPNHEGQTAIKAESRRLMTMPLNTGAGETKTVSFNVNIRTPDLKQDGQVSLRPREADSLTWDDKLTLEFLGEQPAVTSITITPNPDTITIYLVGDSTVVDQREEPWAGWGQMLPVFFDENVAVSNHAESGRSVRSFTAERRFEKILDTLKANDYVFIQFGHNDMKEKGQGIGPYESFQQGLRHFITQIRERDAHPVLVTPMHRRWFNDDGTVQPTFGDYPDAMRQVAMKENTPLIDLQIASRAFYESLGNEGSKRAFVHYPANTFPGQTARLKDDSHHNNYGAYVLARCVVDEIQKQIPSLASQLADLAPGFDPGQPPAPETIDIPASGAETATTRPEGS